MGVPAAYKVLFMCAPAHNLSTSIPLSNGDNAGVAMGVAAQIGGVPALAAVFAALTGMVGALSARWLFGLMRLPTDAEGMALRGFALGTASHAIGAAHAMQVNADAGAYAGLAVGLQLLLAAVLMPLVFRLF